VGAVTVLQGLSFEGAEAGDGADVLGEEVGDACFGFALDVVFLGDAEDFEEWKLEVFVEVLEERCLVEEWLGFAEEAGAEFLGDGLAEGGFGEVEAAAGVAEGGHEGNCHEGCWVTCCGR
jgi:hypothetical protein